MKSRPPRIVMLLLVPEEVEELEEAKEMEDTFSAIVLLGARRLVFSMVEQLDDASSTAKVEVVISGELRVLGMLLATVLPLLPEGELG